MNKKIEQSMPFVLFGMLLLAFAPILMTNYIADDMAFAIGFRNSTVGFWDFTSNTFKSWWLESGRITYLAWVAIRFSFGVIQDLLMYKTYLVVCNLVSALTFVYMCKTLGVKRNQLILLVLCFISVIQIRGSFDPYVSFHGLMPLCSTFVFLSIASYKNRMIIISLATFIVAGLFYEVGYVVLPVIFFLSYFSNQRFLGKALSDVAPYVLVMLLMLLIGAAGKIYGQNALDLTINAAYTANIDFQKMVDVSAKQAIASIPLNYLFLTDRSGNSGVDIKTNKILWFALLVCVPLFCFFVYKYLRKIKLDGLSISADSYCWKNTATVGFVLWLVPGILISVSPKYQDTVRWSQPYITNYLSSIGFSMLLFAGIVYIATRNELINKWVSRVFVGLVAYVAIVTTAYNFYNAALLREAWGAQDFVKSIVWENPKYEACTNKVYSNKWRYWEERLFKDRYAVVETSLVGMDLLDGECALIQENNGYKFYYPGDKTSISNAN